MYIILNEKAVIIHPGKLDENGVQLYYFINSEGKRQYVENSIPRHRSPRGKSCKTRKNKSPRRKSPKKKNIPKTN